MRGVYWFIVALIQSFLLYRLFKRKWGFDIEELDESDLKNVDDKKLDIFGKSTTFIFTAVWVLLVSFLVRYIVINTAGSIFPALIDVVIGFFVAYLIPSDRERSPLEAIATPTIIIGYIIFFFIIMAR